MEFKLVERTGRIILLVEAKDSDKLRETIIADSWIAARKKVKEDKIVYLEGYGWIPR